MATIDVERQEPPISLTGFRLSWGAVFAGFVVALGLEITLGLLGIALGLNVVSTGGAIWTAVSVLIALFVGGTTTGRLAGILRSTDGFLHGAVLWGLATVASVWLAWSGATFVLGQTLNLVGTTTSAAVSGVTNLGATAVETAMNQAGNLDVNAVQREIATALRQTGDPALSPDSLEAVARTAANRATSSGESNGSLIGDLADRVSNRAQHVDRSDIVNVVVARTNLSRPEAERVADRVINAANSIASQARTTVNQIGTQASNLADQAAETVRHGAWLALLLMGLSFGAAIGGTAVTAKQ